MDHPITAKEIQAGIPERYCPFFIVESGIIYREAISIIESFWQAVQIFAPKVKFHRPMYIIISASPFNIKTELFELSYTPKNHVVNSTLETFIFLDINKMANYSKEMQIASVLEEFVHCYMNVSDEDIVKKIVACFYSKVICDNGCYALAKT